MFNKRLKILREESGMTQKEVAEKIAISSRVYAYYETERFPKDAETIKKIAILFNCTTDYLLGASEFRNHGEIKNINEIADVFKQIENPQILENAKDIFSALADMGKNAKQQSSAFAHCLDDVVDSIREISSAYNSSVEKVRDYVKFLEFKNFSMEKIDSIQESVKVMANELAKKIKINFDDDMRN